MTRDELVDMSVLGEEIERLVDNPLVKAHLEEQLARRRAAILELAPHDTRLFSRLRAGIEAIEEFMGGLKSVAELGRQARQRLADDQALGLKEGRVL